MLLLFIFVVLAVFFAWVYIVWNNDYWKNRNIPHEKPLFFYGNYREVFKGNQHFGIMNRELYKKFENDRYVGYFRLMKPSLMIRDPDLIKAILVTDSEYFAENDLQTKSKADYIWNKNILSKTGDVWKTSRKIWSMGMNLITIKAAYDKIQEKSTNMVDYLKRYIAHNPNESLEAKDFVSHFFIDAVVEPFLGMESDSYNMEENPFKSMIEQIYDCSDWESIVRTIFLISPTIGNFLGVRVISEITEHELVAISKLILQHKQLHGFDENTCLDSMLLSMTDPESITEAEVASILFNFVLDGMETCSGLAAYILYSLARYPYWQECLRSEIDDAVNANNGRLSYEDLHGLKYLNMIYLESLRMYSPAVSIQRRCTKPYELPPACLGGQSYIIPPGMLLTIPILAIHTDPAYFPHPDIFEPERFSVENEANIKKFTFLPFGEGPRSCIGTRLLTNQVKICIVAIIKNFEVRLTQNMANKELEVDPDIFIMNAADGIHMTFHLRQTIAA